LLPVEDGPQQDFADGAPTQQKLDSFRACFTKRKLELASPAIERSYKGGKLFYRVALRDQLVKQLHEFYKRRGKSIEEKALPPEQQGEKFVETKLSDTNWWVDVGAVVPHARQGFKTLVRELQEEYSELPDGWGAYTKTGTTENLQPGHALRLSVQKLHEAHRSWGRFALELCGDGPGLKLYELNPILCDKLGQVVQLLGPHCDKSHLQPWPGLALVCGSAPTGPKPTGPNFERLTGSLQKFVSNMPKNKEMLAKYRDYSKESRGLASMGNCLVSNRHVGRRVGSQYAWEHYYVFFADTHLLTSFH
jgi:hypothetical protein